MIKRTLIIFFSAFLFCCSKIDKPEILSGTYEVTGVGINIVGTWIFSKDEITILENDFDKKPFHHLAMIAVQKYYIQDGIIFQCLCSSNDCLKKENYQKFWKIESVNQTETEQIIILKPIGDNSFKISLKKDKSIGLNVKKFHSN